MQPEPNGLEDAILHGKEFLKDEPVLLLASGDVVSENAYAELVAAAEKEKPFAALLAKRVKEYFPGGYISVDESNHIKAIVEKPEPGTEPSDLVNIVIHWYRSGTELIKELQAAEKTRGDANWFDTMIETQVKNDDTCIAVPYEGTWHAMKHPWNVLDMLHRFFAEEAPEPFISKKADIAKTAVINGPAWIEDDVKIFDGAVINGPVYLGKGAVVANNALVRESMIGERSVVGYSTEIARSYLGNDVWTHSNYVGDSVLCDDVSLGAGTVTGNFRLDEQSIPVEVKGEKTDSGKTKLGAFIGPHVRIGINTNIMPGVSIGAGTFIAAGVNVEQNVPAGKFMYSKQEQIVIKDNRHTAHIDRSDLMKHLHG